MLSILHPYRFIFLRWLLLIVFAAMGSQLVGQKQANWWYLGKFGALNFNKITNGLPEALDKGKLDAYQALATISDQNGDLLFYTDGAVVLDAKHDTMPNGTGLLGNKTTTQVIIVPNPTNSKKYYIFHNYYFTQPSFSYSEVDMSLRGGLGDVIVSTKNTVLSTTKDLIAERIAAVKMKGKNGFWVVVHNIQNHVFSNEYYSYAVTAAGVNPVPVVSKLGPIPKATTDFAGESKFNPCGTKYATIFQTSATVILMDFDAFTGKLSNARSDIPDDPKNRLYGLDFSENGNLLYTANMLVKNKAKIFQYSTVTNSSAAFAGSLVTLTNPLIEEILGFQRGPDGKIYFIYKNQNALGVIHDPDLPGTSCNVDPNGPVFPKATFGWSHGLPNFVSSFFCTDPRIETKKYCFGEQTHIWLAGTIEKVDSVHFDYGDPNSTNKYSKNLLDSHLYSSTGTFDIIAVVFKTYGGVVFSDTIRKRIEIKDISKNFLGRDTSICLGDTIPLAPNFRNSSTIWNNSLNRITHAYQAGIYHGKNEIEGCIGYDTIQVDILPLTEVDIGPDTTLCKGEMILAPKNYNSNYTYEWNDGLQEAQQTITSTGSYAITAFGPCGKAFDSILVEDCLCEIKFPNVFTPNDDGYNDIFKPINTCKTEFHRFSIYNRWGVEMFNSENKTPAWSGEFKGKKCITGVYFWEVEYQQKNEQLEKQKGNLMLIRD